METALEDDGMPPLEDPEDDWQFEQINFPEVEEPRDSGEWVYDETLAPYGDDEDLAFFLSSYGNYNSV